jgi:signal transduction histidine kinase
MGAEVRGFLKDDGVGFDLAATASNGGFGLVGMDERIRKLGGKLSIETSPGKGTTISFVAPKAVPQSKDINVQ